MDLAVVAGGFQFLSSLLNLGDEVFGEA